MYLPGRSNICLSYIGTKQIRSEAPKHESEAEVPKVNLAAGWAVGGKDTWRYGVLELWTDPETAVVAGWFLPACGIGDERFLRKRYPDPQLLHHSNFLFASGVMSKVQLQPLGIAITKSRVCHISGTLDWASQSPYPRSSLEQ